MSDNATRLALGIPDVLQEIFSHFSPVQCWGTAIPPLCEYDISTNVFRVDRTSLAYCAQVCKSWSPYALDVLWAALPYRISPLLGLFPGFRQSSLSVSEERSLAATIEGHVYQISELDLRRFQQYAFRVKCVLYHRRHYHQSPQCDSVTDSYQFKEDCESTLLAQLCELNGGQPILPNLRILRWSAPETPAHELALRILAGPQLAAFYLEGVACIRGREDAEISSALEIIRVVCPTLQHLRITGPPVHHPDSSADHVLRHFADIRSIKLHYAVPGSMFSALALLPRLEVLDVELQSLIRPMEYLFPRNAFSALQELTVRGKSPMDLERFLQGFTSNRISSIKLWIRSCYERSIMGCVEALSLLPCAKTLTKLNLEVYIFGRYDGDQSQDDMLSLNVLLQPLLSIHRLEEVILDLGEVEVIDTDLCSIAAAWPLLRSLKLYSWPFELNHDQRKISSPSNPLRRPSLLHVVDFASKMSSLESLGVEAAAVSLNELTKIEELVTNVAPQTNLVEFNCLISEEDRLKATLSRLFPKAALGLSAEQREAIRRARAAQDFNSIKAKRFPLPDNIPSGSSKP